jgi:hypothetical protein
MHVDALWQEGFAMLKWMVSAARRASILIVVGWAVRDCALLDTGRATVLAAARTQRTLSTQRETLVPRQLFGPET